MNNRKLLMTCTLDSGLIVAVHKCGDMIDGDPLLVNVIMYDDSGEMYHSLEGVTLPRALDAINSQVLADLN